MGVPALFRWLSKKYPKIIYPVVEEEDTETVTGDDGEQIVVPKLFSPNGDFDNLYLDMNGIVHPCTHPEGKPAPETEQEMMVEIFNYTERVFDMIRPRKLLFMAIDGVAPRAKMNQQRSRRFRAAQEAKEKEDARQESLLLWQAMGKDIPEDEKTKEAWDSNAITPGTPFMDLLAASLRYWVVQKMNTDPNWRDVQVLISDSSVPGEGEHKIMDFIRRQRANPGHDPNTRHVIYGLDADLIMLALATHEPNFRVLREDVFQDGKSSTACRTCGQEGHFANQCTGTAAPVAKKDPPEKKPFIFLDVAILREYLEVELDIPNSPFPFHLEQAIDDWVLLIFFVGNDFLPHLPSLEIREGAIDTLLRIWKQELPRMGGYLTNHGQLNLPRVQVILEGLAQREDDIFRKRREGEQRQEENNKRRKLDQERRNTSYSAGPSAALNLTSASTTPAPQAFVSSVPTVHPSLPKRPPANDFAANADSIGLGAAPTEEAIQNRPAAAMAFAGSNSSIVANRRAIRLANMSAADVLKAELAGLVPVKPSASKPSVPTPATPLVTDSMSVDIPSKVPQLPQSLPTQMDEQPDSVVSVKMETTEPSVDIKEESEDTAPFPDGDEIIGDSTEDQASTDGAPKRKFEEGPGAPDVDEDVATAEEEEEEDTSPLKMKKNADGSIEQEDRVKLWEPGYKERYYRSKFHVEHGDVEFRKQVTHAYVEGMAWVLHYYYQGPPSWQWYYPYHFAPFAADFEDVANMNIEFKLGEPFKPFEQLMGVFPAASRKHIPSVFHRFMTDDDSPIIDFYPSTFEIDMNGKKMAWQGVALLPFIDEKRLLDAMALEYPNLKEDEVLRNDKGNHVLFATTGNPLYPFYESLYGKRKNKDPAPINAALGKGFSGFVLPNPDCLPGSTYYSPLKEQGLDDIKSDQSLSVIYFFPEQLTPHRSVLLPGLVRPPRVLTASDLETTRSGGRGRGRGRGNGFHQTRNDPFHSRPVSHGSQSYGNGQQSGHWGGYGGSGGGGGGGGGYSGGGGTEGGYGGSYDSYGGGGGGGSGYGSYAPRGNSNPRGGGGYGGRPPSGQSSYNPRQGVPPSAPMPSSYGSGGGYSNNSRGRPQGPQGGYGYNDSRQPPQSSYGQSRGGYNPPPSNTGYSNGRGDYGGYGGYGGYGQQQGYGQQPQGSYGQPQRGGPPGRGGQPPTSRGQPPTRGGRGW